MRMLLCSALAVFLIAPAGAFAAPFDNCQEETRVNNNASGRTILKPLAAHYSQAVIVASRGFWPRKTTVELFDIIEGNPKIERAQLKSTGLCAGHPECLFAATFLTKKTGKAYKRKYGSVYVRIKGTRSNGTPRCTYYLWANPAQKVNYVGTELS